MGYTCQSPSMFSTNAPTNVGTAINCLSHVSTLSLHSVGSRSCTNHTSSVVVTRPHLCQLLLSRILISNRLKVIQAFSQGGGLRMYRTHWHCLVGGNTGYMIWVAARAPGLHVVYSLARWTTVTASHCFTVSACYQCYAVCGHPLTPL